MTQQCSLDSSAPHVSASHASASDASASDVSAADVTATVLSWRASVTPDTAPVDMVAAERAATDLLRALGQPIGSDGMAETPRRMAQAYAEMLTCDGFDFTTFANAEGYDELVVMEDIPVRSVCEHHMLPFVGVAHLGYLPADRILGLSKLARLVEFYAHRAQTQERLTQQVAEHLDRHLAPRGVGVVIEAEHTCMSLRGVRAAGTRTVTSALLGTLRTDPASRAEFLSLTRGAGPGCRS
jgi:GTP cyclohydrolase IA